MKNADINALAVQNMLNYFELDNQEIEDQFEILNSHMASILKGITSKIEINPKTHQVLTENIDLELTADPALIILIKDLKKQLNIKFHNESFEIRLADSFNIYFLITSFFAFLKSHAIPLINENKKEVADQQLSSISRKLLQEAIKDEPQNLPENLALIQLLESLMKQMTSSLEGFMKMNYRSGRNNYFAAYWLCAELSKTLKEFGSTKSNEDLIKILTNVEKIYPQYFDDFPPIDKDLIKQAVKRGRKISKESTQDTVEGV